MEGALREGREGAHLLDLVAEELDPQRLAAGGREDVDDAAAHGELAAVVDTLHALVPGERELLGEPVDARLSADPELDRSRACGERRQSLGERERRRAHEPARGEHVERAVPLTDEVRRGRKPRVEPHAAAGQERDARATREPPGRLGGIPRVRVLGEEDEQPPPELLVEGGEQQRQHGLRHACPGRERAGERLEALVPAQLVDEGGERSRRGLVPAGQVCEQSVVHAIGRATARRGHRTEGRSARFGRRSRRSARSPTCPQGHPRALLER